MGVLSWLLFWPDKHNHSFLFHLFRQSVIIGLFLLAFLVNPSLFTVYLLLISIIEYTRRCRLSELLALYFTFNFVTWLTGLIIQPFVSTKHPTLSVYDLLRSVVIFMAVVLDRLTSKRFGFASHITTFAFPIFLTCSSEFLNVTDHLGLSIHISAFCNDYPDFTLVPLRFLGCGGLSFLIGFLASYTSSWKAEKFNTKAISFLLFGVVPFTIISVFISNSVFAQKEVFASSAIIQNFDQNNVSYVVEKLENLINAKDFIIVQLPLLVDPARILGLKTVSSVVIFTTEINGTEKLYSMTPNKTFTQDIVHHKKPKVPLLMQMNEMLTLDTKLGRTGILIGRDAFFMEFIASNDIDFLITFGGSQYDEMGQLYRRSASLISQLTGACRFHVSAYDQTFLIRGNGRYIFRDSPTKQAIREFNLASERNLTPHVGKRMILFTFLFNVVGLFFIVFNFIPISYVRDITTFGSHALRIAKQHKHSFSM